MGTIGVGVIGFGWMGRVHAQAHARLRHHFPDVGLVPELVAVADEVRGRAEQAAAQFGFAAATTAVTLARRLMGEGAIGRVTHARFAFLSDYAAAPEGALTWRYERARGGNGVLGDLASHAVDLVRFDLDGEVDSVLADSAVFVAERLRPTGATSGHSVAADGVPGQVENDDHVAALLRLSTGARVAVEASRVAVGEQNAYGFEVHGTAGRLAWDFRRMGELQLSRGPAAQDQPVATVLVRPDAGEYAAFSPVPGSRWATTTSRSSSSATCWPRSWRAVPLAPPSPTPCVRRSSSTRSPPPRRAARGSTSRRAEAGARPVGPDA